MCDIYDEFGGTGNEVTGDHRFKDKQVTIAGAVRKPPFYASFGKGVAIELHGSGTCYVKAFMADDDDMDVDGLKADDTVVLDCEVADNEVEHSLEGINIKSNTRIDAKDCKVYKR